MTRRELLRRFVTVHKCGGCGEILEYERCDGAFCKKCELAWNAARLKSCPECLLPAVECRCMPKLTASAGALFACRLFFYESESAYTPEMKLVYHVKHGKSKRISSFVARELLCPVREELSVLTEPSEVLVTYIPRSRRSMVVYGFDQSKMIAEELAELLGAECVRLFKKKRGAAQKELDQKERAANARRTIVPDDGIDVKGRYVLLVDDVITTGASTAACVRSLVSRGAAGVACAALATKNKT